MNAPIYSPDWKIDSNGDLVSPTGKRCFTALPTAAGHAVTKAYADETRGLTKDYASNKTLAAADFEGRDLRYAKVSLRWTAGATVLLPNDASRQSGARITFVRRFSGNLIIDGNGASVQQRSHSFGSQSWFEGAIDGTVTYEWTGTVWAYVGLPGSLNAQIQSAAVYDPNNLEFISTDSRYRTFISPATRSSYSASLANGADLTCDFALTTNNRLVEILYKVRVARQRFDCIVIAHRDNAGVVTIVSNGVIPVYGAGNYASPYNIGLVPTIVSSTTVRLTLNNQSGSARVVSMGAVAAQEDDS